MKRFKVQDIFKKKITWMIIVVIVVLCFLIPSKVEEEKLYDDLDAAREECRTGINATELYPSKDAEYLQSIIVDMEFDDNDLSNSWFHTNRDVVKITMNSAFENLPLKSRCEKCVRMMEEMRPKLEKRYKDSRYYSIFSEHCGSSGSMKYRNVSLYAYHEAKFIFQDDDYEYRFPSYDTMTIEDKNAHIADFYTYSFISGKFSDFQSKYGSSSVGIGTGSSGASTQKEDSKKSEITKTEKKTGKKSGKKTTTYDPYDAKDYKDAQSFADDKYEEFYDYEDEAYDAAEDYWNDHH